jgi:hypothetical protein
MKNMSSCLSRYLLLPVAVVTAAAACLLTGVGAASAQPLPVTVSSVSISGYPTSPTITVVGSGFRRHAFTNGVSPATLSNCGSGTGLDYPKSELWLLDASRSGGLSGAFQEGSLFSRTTGNCGGIIISSWSRSQIVFTLGSRYSTDGHYLESGDVACVDVELVPACTTLP